MKVIVMKSAKKDMKKLDRDTRKKIEKEIRLLRQGTARITALSGHRDSGKIKVGNYRVRYDIDRKEKLIKITEVILRKDAYRDL
ncbi:MAG: Plasmid stabilization system protein [bacterium ADurb.Bin363]|nr:MAG: Plasmid stabilization system protein [bacterium ADurb.Bin363]